MVSKCANPECASQFHYLHDGRLYQLEVPSTQPEVPAAEAQAGPQLAGNRMGPRRVEYFWLCGGCAAAMTLAFDKASGGVTAVPLPHHARRAAAS